MVEEENESATPEARINSSQSCLTGIICMVGQIILFIILAYTDDSELYCQLTDLQEYGHYNVEQDRHTFSNSCKFDLYDNIILIS